MLGRIREVKGLSLEELAQAVGYKCSISKVFRWECGELAPTESCLKALVVALDISDELLLDIISGTVDWPTEGLEGE